MLQLAMKSKMVFFFMGNPVIVLVNYWCHVTHVIILSKHLIFTSLNSIFMLLLVFPILRSSICLAPALASAPAPPLRATNVQ